MPRELDLLTIITIVPPHQYVTVEIYWQRLMQLPNSRVPMHAGCVEASTKSMLWCTEVRFYERRWWQSIGDWLAGTGHCFHCHGPRRQDQWS